MYLANVRLLVDDFRGCFRFYRDVMGFPVTWGEDSDEEGYASFQTGECAALAIFKRVEMAAAVGTSGIPVPEVQDSVALIFEEPDREGFDRRIEELKNRGARFLDAPEDRPDWGIRSVYLRDPEGNLIEIETSLPREEVSESLKEDFDKYATQT